MRLLELLAFSPLSAPQLAAALHAQPRTVRRVLTRLVAEGYVEVQGDRRRLYVPTMRLVALAAQVVENSELARAARPYVLLLEQRCSATAHLVVPSYQQVVCLVHAAPPATTTHPQLRELVPAHCTAGGKALLAWREPWRESVLSAALERFTEHTITEADELRRELLEVRARGHAREVEEYQRGVRAIAVPLLVAGEAAAALVVSGPRLDLEKTLPRLEGIASDLAADMSRDGGQA